MLIRAFALLMLCAALGPVRAAAPHPKVEVKAAPRSEIRKGPAASIDVLALYLQRSVGFEEIDDPKATLRDCLNLLQTKYAIPVKFQYNEAAFRADGEGDKSPAGHLFGKFEGGEMSVEAYLRTLLGRVELGSGAVFLLRHGHIEITTENAVRRELRLPAVVRQEGRPLERLPPLLPYMKFTDESLEDACAEIAEKAGVSVVIDPRVKEKAATKVPCRLINIPLDTAVELVADMAGLAVARKANAYYVTTPENAARMKTKGG